MNPIRRAFIIVSVGSLMAGSANSAPTASQRYPYDPACPWGRISNGRGMFVRCLTEAEAQALSGATATPPASSAPIAAPATSSSSSGSVPAAASDTTSTDQLIAELVSVDVEEGTLPLAQKKLSVPLDRYRECVTTNGGLKGPTGQVTVKFLVRERGRVEGASAEKFSGMSEKAAQCIADVIDRRPTGTPDSPIVAATAVVRVRRKTER